MLHGSAWAARRDRALASVEYPQQRCLAEWTDDGTRRRTEWEDKRARRQADFAARIPVMAAQVASELKAEIAAEVTKAVTTALQAAFARPHGGLDLVSTTTSTPMVFVADDHDLNLAPATTLTTARSVAANYEPTATLTYSRSAKHAPAIPLVTATPASVPTMSVISDLALMAPITCSTKCPGRDNGATEAKAAPSTTGVVPSECVVQNDIVRPASSCLQRMDLLACALPPSMAMLAALPVHVSNALADFTVASPSADIVFDLRAPTPTTTKPVESAVLESKFSKTAPASSAVCLDPISDAPATILMQNTLDIMDSHGSDALASMSVLQDKPEGTDTVVTHDDEQLLVCASNVVDDDNFVTGMSAMPLTLAALGVDDGCVANTFEFLLLFKLTVPLSKSKELYTSSLLPQCTQALVTWGTSLNQLHAEYNGMYSDLGFVRATTHLISLLPWDPGERARVLRDSACSKDIALGACVQQLDADLSRIHDHDQKSGYANTQTYFHWFIQLSCSSENAICKYFCQDIYMELLRYLFDSVGPFPISSATRQEFMDRYSVIVVVSLIFVLMCNEAVLWPFLQSGAGHMIQLLPLDPGQALSGMGTKLTTTNRVACLQVLSIHELFSCSFEVELIKTWMVKLVEMQTWPSWKNSLLVTTLYHQPPAAKNLDKRNCILANKTVNIQWSLHIVDCFWSAIWLERSTFLFEFKFSGQRGQYSSCIILMSKGAIHYDPLLEIWFQPFSTGKGFLYGHGSGQFQWEIAWLINLDYLVVGNKLRLAMPWDPGLWHSVELIQKWMVSLSLAELQFWTSCDWLLVVSSYADSNCGIGGNLINIWMMLKVIWPLELVCSATGKKYVQLVLPAIGSYEANIEKRSTILLPFSTRTVQVSLLFLPYVAMCSSCSLKFCQRKFSWDPGIWALLFFLNFSHKLKQKGRRNAAAPAYYRDHCLDHVCYFDNVCADQDYYLDVFHDQVHIGHAYYLGAFFGQVGVICYLNLIKVCLNYNIHHDLGEVMKYQVPWDPGGLTWHRLEVKPKFKEGGMLATLLTLPWAGPWANTIGPGLLGSNVSQQLQIHWKWLTNEAAWIRTASASSLLSPLPLVFMFLSSSLMA